MANLPPTDIGAADLWTQITQVPRAFRVVDFPRKGEDGNPIGQLAMWVLTQEESMIADASTERAVRKMLRESGSMPSNGEPTQGYSSLYEKRVSLEILYRCCRKVDDLSKPFFPAIEAIGAKLTTDEIGVLVHNYIRIQSEVGPIVSSMSQDEVDAWIERLATGGKTFFFRLIVGGSLGDPHAFYGIPVVGLTDGQMLAWLAAKREYHRRQGD